MSEKPNIGEYAKVYLPGESPWAMVLEHTEKGFMGRIDNNLFGSMDDFTRARFTKEHFDSVEPLPRLHNYKRGDIVHFINYGWGYEPEGTRKGYRNDR